MATLAGGANPGGRITFVFYARLGPPADWGPGGSGAVAGSAMVTGNGTYPSSAVTVTRAGRYRWIASYSGDPNNNAVSTSCGDAGETRSEEHTSELQSRPHIACRLLLETNQDMATLGGAVHPRGTITLTL